MACVLQHLPLEVQTAVTMSEQECDYGGDHVDLRCLPPLGHLVDSHCHMDLLFRRHHVDSLLMLSEQDILAWLSPFPEAVFGLSSTFLSVNSGSKEEKAVCGLDLSKLLLESDAPYLSPPGKPGLNHPWNIARVAKTVAKLRGLTIEMVFEATRLSA